MRLRDGQVYDLLIRKCVRDPKAGAKPSEILKPRLTLWRFQCHNRMFALAHAGLRGAMGLSSARVIPDADLARFRPIRNRSVISFHSRRHVR